MIASVTIRNFRALKNASLSLLPFNLVIGPNGSGKTSLVHALMHLKKLARLPLREPGAAPDASEKIADGPEIFWHFDEPFDGLEAVMRCVSETECDYLDVTTFPSGAGQGNWPVLRAKLMNMRSYVFDHHALAARSNSRDGAELKSDGSNLATVITTLHMHSPKAFEEMRAELCRILPEYDDIQWTIAADGSVRLALRLAVAGEAGGGELIPAEYLSQGTLYLLAILALAYEPNPPSLVCIEEIDRGFHPRLLRDVRDVLYRLSYPRAYGLKREPVQVIATTHSPYLLDLFNEHPEEIVLSEKRGTRAYFWRLSEREDLKDLMQEGGLGDMWFSGILGGVPQETMPSPENGATDADIDKPHDARG